MLYYFSSPHIGKNGRFSQSLLFHSIPIPYVVRAYEAKYWVSYGKFSADHCMKKNFSKSYVLHILTVANFFPKNFSKSPYVLHSLQVAVDGRIFRFFSKSPMLSIRCRWLWYCSFSEIFLSAGKVVFRSLCFFTRYLYLM